MKNYNLKFKIIKSFYFLVFVFTFSFLVFNFCQAAVLYLLPQSQNIYHEDSFLVEVRIDTEGEEINAIETYLTFPSSLLEAIDFSKGDSILTLWAEEPSIIGGTVSFIGGVPGGFNGDGKIGRVIFKGKREGKAVVNFKENCQVLLNDGLGTSAKLSTQKADFTILTEKLEIPRDKWQEEIEKDKIPPEPFEIKISQSPTIFEGKYFLSFSTIDRQTGISHYEVKEGKREWKRGKSPYLLEDQSLKSKILVKAVDKAGNERIAEILPPKKPFPYWVVIIVIIVLLIICWIIKKYFLKKITNESTKIH